MGDIKRFTPEKLVLAMLVSGLEKLEPVKRELQSLWGPIDCVCEPELFTHSQYYYTEMGSPLYRAYCSFVSLTDPSGLAEIKIKSNEKEKVFSGPSGRAVNLDPGLLCESKFILATTKNNAHRIPLKKGIYGELTLQYKRGEFRELPWTYPDYREEGIRSWLKEVRAVYKAQLKNGRPSVGIKK